MKLEMINSKMTLIEIMDEADLDNETVFYDAVNWGLQECKSKETIDYKIDMFFLTNSSHGAGVFGFGGDEAGGSEYLLSIKSIKNMLTDALTANNVDKFSIIGFDACVMQSYSVLGELESVTDYILASVALEPGHGWNYDYLENSASPEEYAIKIIDGFVDSKHGYAYHVPDKTLSLVSTKNFDTVTDSSFSTVSVGDMFDSINGRLYNELQTNNDLLLYNYINTARGNASSYEGVFNESSWESNSIIDIYSFYSKLNDLCQPNDAAFAAEMDEFLDVLKNKTIHYSRYGVSTPVTHGLGIIFVPLSQRDWFPTIKSKYLNHPHMADYTNMLEAFYYFDNQSNTTNGMLCNTNNQLEDDFGIDCSYGLSYAYGNFAKETIQITYDSFQMHACLRNTISGYIYIAFMMLGENNARFIQSLDTTYFNNKMKATYDNYAIALYENNIFLEYLFTYKDDDSYSLYIWIYDYGFDGTNHKYSDGTQILDNGEYGMIMFSYEQCSEYSSFSIFKLEFDDDGFLSSYLQLNEGFTNQIVLLNEFEKGYSAFVYDENTKFVRHHLKNLKNVDGIYIYFYAEDYNEEWSGIFYSAPYNKSDYDDGSIDICFNGDNNINGPCDTCNGEITHPEDWAELNHKQIYGILFVIYAIIYC
eukprot:Mrub_01275.p1 GENE.Mrub_01275~~Mrub_01275.p1  ORF type:complete len:729 (-),score=69.21 Mrub_01275:105-2042(-)